MPSGQKWKSDKNSERGRLSQGAVELFCITGFDGFLRQINPGFTRLLEFTEQDMLAEPFLNFVHPEDRKATEAELAKLTTSLLAALSFENRFRRKDGSYRRLQWNAEVSPGKQTIYATARDITEIDPVKRERRSAGQRFAMAFTLNPHPMCMSTLDERFIEINEAFLKFTGLQRHEIVGRTGAELGLWERTEQRQEFLNVIQTQRGVRNFEVHCRNGKGEHRVVLLSSDTVQLEGQTLVITAATDITERKRADEALRNISAGTAAVTGGEFFDVFPRHLAAALGVQCAFLTEMRESSQRSRVLAFWPDGKLRSIFEEEVAAGLWDAVMRETGVVHYTAGMRDALPESRLLTEQMAGYLYSSPLTDRKGTLIGRLSVCHDQPLADEVLAVSILNIFVARASVELERMRAEEALRFSEQRFRSVFEHSNDPILVLDPVRGVIVDGNPTACQLLGYSQEELQDLSMLVVHPYDTEPMLRFVRQVLEEGHARTEALECVSKAGCRIPAEISAATFTQINGEGRVLAVVRDISERKRAELALRESEQRFSKAFNFSPFPLALVSLPEEKFVNVNESFARESGYDRADIVGRTAGQVDFWEFPERWTKVLRDIQAQKAVRNLETVLRRADGKRRVALLSVEAIEMAGQQYMLLAYNDITERKRAEEALRESEQRYRTLTEHAPEAVVTLDLDSGHFVDVNKNAVELFGYSREQLLNMGPVDVSAPFQSDGRPTRELALEKIRAAQSGESAAFEWMHRHSSGREIPCEVRLVRIPSTSQTLVRGSITDITERKQAEEALRRSEEQLRQSQKIEAIGRLAGGVAHDFNNLLSVIMGYTDLLLQGLAPGDPLRKNAENIRNASGHAASLTRQLLTFSRKQVTSPKVLDLNAILVETGKLLPRMLGDDIEMALVAADEPATVFADRSQMEQVIMNLAVNARDAMPQGGQLIVEISNVSLDEEFLRQNSLAPPGDYVLLTVTDTGTGITPEIKAHMFEPFFTTKETGKGTGLGLSTVYGIVKQTGGNISVSSAPRLGTTFKIYLPRVHQAAEEPMINSSSKPDSLRGSETILLVEDQEQLRILTQNFLASHGYDVIAACRPSEAMDIVSRMNKPIDLLLTDVVMPGMNGRELAEKLQPVFPKMKVLYVSGYGEDVIVHKGVVDPNVIFMEKPFMLMDLLKQVRTILESKPAAKPKSRTESG